MEDQSVTISEDTARLIRKKVEDGSFATPADVVGAAMEAFVREAEDQAERLAMIKARIRASIEDKGPGYSSAEVFGEIRERLKARIASGFHEEPSRPLE